MAIALSGAGFAVHAQTSAKADSLKVVNLQEVQVVSHACYGENSGSIHQCKKRTDQ